MEKDIEYTNSAMEHAIDEYIHSKRDRLILKAYYIDDITPEEMAKWDDVNIEPRQIRNVIRKCLEKLTDYI